jgi:hypothetical protein
MIGLPDHIAMDGGDAAHGPSVCHTGRSRAPERLWSVLVGKGKSPTAARITPRQGVGRA